MLRSGRGKQLVTLILNTAEVTEEHDTNKENQQDERQQVEECETATLMVLAGDSLKTQQILIEKSVNIQNEDLILPEDLELINHNGASFSSLGFEPLLENQSLLLNKNNADELENVWKDTDCVLSPNTFQEISAFNQYDIMLDNDCRNATIDETSTSVLAGNETQDAGSSSSVQEEVQCNIPQTNVEFNNQNNDPESSNQGNSVQLLHAVDEDPNNHNMDEVQCEIPQTNVEFYNENNDPGSSNQGNSLQLLHAIDEDPNNHNMDEGRKRKKVAEPDLWKRNINKKLRMEGKSYLGFTRESNKVIQNKPKPGRRMKETCKSEVCKKSKYRHCDKFTEEQRKGIFEHFWSIDWKQRKAFVCAQVTQIATKKNTTANEESRQGSTLEYRLNNGCQQGNFQVCREMFLNTLGIGYRMMQLWVKKSTFGIPNPTTSDPSHRTSRRVSNLERTASLKLFFDTLPKMPSHYARQNSSKLYLEPVFSSKIDVYKLYKAHAEEKGFEIFSFKKFCEVFDRQNLSLFCVKKDKCNTCSSHETGNLSDTEYNLHVERKNRARQEKAQDKERAEKGELILLQMDFQAVKLAPFTLANAFYFKTKLACHNQTIMNVVSKHVKCYWFSEDQCNQLVASTFVSCLLDYLQNYCVTEGKTPIVIYSDGCTAQNRNNILANALLNFSMLTGIQVFQKFLEVGHTQMEVDSVHACIERKLKNREIKLPSDYVTLTKEARLTPSRYEAEELQYTFFKDYSGSEFLRYSSLRPGRFITDPCVTDIKVIYYNPEGMITVKTDFSNDWIALRQRPKKINVIQEYPPMFMGRCKISKTKWQHLQDLKAVIPRDCHSFYDNLAYSTV